MSKLKVGSDTKLPQRGWSVPHLEDAQAERCQAMAGESMVGYYTHGFSPSGKGVSFQYDCCFL